MKKGIALFIFTVVIAVSAYALSSIGSPHWGELVTTGKRHLFYKQVSINVKHYNSVETYTGTLIDYSTADLCLRITSSTYNTIAEGDIVVFPLNNVLYVKRIK